MKNLQMSSAVLVSVLLGSVQAQTLDEFERADTDGNGLLSIAEAQEEFSGHTIRDTNNDGFLNHSEAEAAIEGLSLPGEEAGTNAVVGASDYLEMHRAIIAQQNRQRSSEEES